MIISYTISCKPSCLPKQGLKPLRGYCQGLSVALSTGIPLLSHSIMDLESIFEFTNLEV